MDRYRGPQPLIGRGSGIRSDLAPLSLRTYWARPILHANAPHDQTLASIASTMTPTSNTRLV
jgi:hypothetical protein